MKCRFVCPTSPNNGLLVESLGSPGYDFLTDTMRDDLVHIVLLEDAKNCPAGRHSSCRVDQLVPVEENA